MHETPINGHKPAGHAPATNGKHAPAPQLTRLTDSVELVAPPGYSASVILKLVKRDDGHRYYVIWMVAGRHELEAATVMYKHTGEDAIRCDLPEGMPLSAEALEPHLVRYLDSLGEKPGDPPVITH